MSTNYKYNIFKNYLNVNFYFVTISKCFLILTLYLSFYESLNILFIHIFTTLLFYQLGSVI